MALSEGRIGPVRGATGSPLVMRGGNDGELIVAQSLGEDYEAGLRDELFTACNVAAQAVSVALATTYTGLVLSNPNNSTRNLSLLYCNYALSVAPAAIAPLFLLGGKSTTEVVHTTPLAAPGIMPSKVGNAAASVAKVDSAATIPTPYYLMPIMGGFTAAALPSTGPSLIRVGGGILIPPGGFVAIGALTAVTGFGFFMWQEKPILPA